MIEDANLEDPRDLVARGEWTWDKFREYCQVLTRDIDGDGVIDVYGYGGWLGDFLPYWFMSNGTYVAATATENFSSPEVGETLKFLQGGEAINLSQSSDKRADLLHLVEYGASPHYTFTWKDSAEMKYTGLNENFATTFSAWKDAAVSDYEYVNGALKNVKGARMTAFERLSDTLSKVSYSNGAVIYVNYAEQAAQADGRSVPAKDYLVAGGEEK